MLWALYPAVAVKTALLSIYVTDYIQVFNIN